MNGTDAAMGQPANAVGDLIMDIAAGELRLVAITELGLVEAALHAALAVGQFAL